jgi:hypothetical protein
MAAHAVPDAAESANAGISAHSTVRLRARSVANQRQGFSVMREV